jgi:mannose-6-phosphate isomerase-like protein (cupin superfamily)
MSGGATTYGGDIAKAEAKPIVVKQFAAPDKMMNMPPTGDTLATAAVVDLGTAKAMKIVLQPGATWALCGKPMLPPEKQHLTACPARHVGMITTGKLWCKGADGSEKEITPGMMYVMEPGHDIKVLGDEAVTMYEVESVLGDAAVAAGGGTTYMSTDAVDAKPLVVQHVDNEPTKKMEMPNGAACVCMMGTAKGMKATLQPGWTWKTGARTMLPPDKQDLDRCPARHVGFVLKGTFHMKNVETGLEVDAKEGECYVCEPGHDAWVVGDVPVEFIEFESKIAA